MGSVASEATAAAAKLAGARDRGARDRRRERVAGPADDLQAALADVPLAVSVEAHYVNGGLGSLVAEVIAERGLGCRLVRQAVHELPDARVGSQSYMHGRHGLAAPALVATVLERLGRRA
jgi:transketolase